MKYVLGLVVLLAVVLAGCGETTIKTTTVGSGGALTDQDASETTPTEPAKGPSDLTADIGGTITLNGYENASLKVTLTKVRDPLTLGEFDTTDAGKRPIGVELRVTNVGSKPYADSLSNGATILSKNGRSYDSTFYDTCGGYDDVKIAPGSTRRGCIPFDVGTRTKLATLQLTLDSGFADDTGEWTL